ncbi:CHAT domain-containing protein [Bosea sp. (in: a-proteobacteria)]|uniref:CHAT domain-containing protein n=1 Tax=Bosea sp. (in: a-proteobacteria) TaxID=1871050 RepID=UPI003B3AD825
MRKRLSDQQVAFLEFELSHGDAKAKKVALQTLCSAYRSGSFIAQESVGTVEGLITSQLLVDRQDLKVIRWGLNALAQCGRWRTCHVYVEQAIRMYDGIPEIIAAGIAALCRMLKGHTRDFEILNKINPTIWKLAALQIRDPNTIDLSGLNVDIDNSDLDVIKLALILVGINKDIENLFHPKHTNGTFVKELCLHDDSIVQQYSVWAVTENDKLSLEHLGIDFQNIPRLRPNVQSKMYQLAAQRQPDLRARLRVIADGAFADALEAREGLAKGIKANYFDGLEEVVLPWLEREDSKAIRGLLAEHIAGNADDCGPYADAAQSLFEEAPELQSRLLLGAEGTALYATLKSSRQNDLLTALGNGQELASLVRMAQMAKSKSKLKVVMLLASPKDQDPLRLDEEVRDTQQKLQLVQNSKVDIDIKHEWAVRLTEIADHLLNEKPQVIHFSGHGGNGAIYVEDAIGDATPLNGNSFADLIKALGGVECVLLNACFSDDLTNSIKPHVKVVIGCDDSIDDDAALAFSRAFYRALAHGRDYQSSFNLAVADVSMTVDPDEAKKFKIKI